MIDYSLNKVIVLFECVQMTKGYNRTLLIDFQRNDFDFIDNTIFDIIVKSRKDKTTVNEILHQYNDSGRENILEYLEFLVAKQYIFFCDASEIDSFPLMDLRWDFPGIISNCLIDYNPEISSLSYGKLFKQLDALGCAAMQIRDFQGLRSDQINKIFDQVLQTSITKVDLILKFTGRDIDYYKDLLKLIPVINELVIHSHHEEQVYNIENDQILFTTKQQIVDHTFCGVVSNRYFNLSLEHYTESQSHNTCLNRKVSVDFLGNIKNCPTLHKVYGHIDTCNLEEICDSDDFKSYWNINKDKVKVCKICEFRHICTDCRAFHTSEDRYNKPFKCTYNPQTLTWDSLP